MSEDSYHVDQEEFRIWYDDEFASVERSSADFTVQECSPLSDSAFLRILKDSVANRHPDAIDVGIIKSLAKTPWKKHIQYTQRVSNHWRSKNPKTTIQNGSRSRGAPGVTAGSNPSGIGAQNSDASQAHQSSATSSSQAAPAGAVQRLNLNNNIIRETSTNRILRPEEYATHQSSQSRTDAKRLKTAKRKQRLPSPDSSDPDSDPDLHDVEEILAEQDMYNPETNEEGPHILVKWSNHETLEWIPRDFLSDGSRPLLERFRNRLRFVGHSAIVAADESRFLEQEYHVAMEDPILLSSVKGRTQLKSFTTEQKQYLIDLHEGMDRVEYAQDQNFTAFLITIFLPPDLAAIRELFDARASHDMHFETIEMLKQVARAQHTLNLDNINAKEFKDSAFAFVPVRAGNHFLSEVDAARAHVAIKHVSAAMDAWARYLCAVNGVRWLSAFEHHFGASYPLPEYQPKKPANNFNTAVLAACEDLWPPYSPEYGQSDNYKRAVRKQAKNAIKMAWISQWFGIAILFDPNIAWARVNEWKAPQWDAFCRCFNSERAQSSELVRNWKSTPFEGAEL